MFHSLANRHTNMKKQSALITATDTSTPCWCQTTTSQLWSSSSALHPPMEYKAWINLLHKHYLCSSLYVLFILFIFASHQNFSRRKAYFHTDWLSYFPFVPFVYWLSFLSFCSQKLNTLPILLPCIHLFMVGLIVAGKNVLQDMIDMPTRLSFSHLVMV